jgi:DNA helicase-2/ATP-dependent DNA helicase PcrA
MVSAEELLADLTPEQAQATTHVDGPLLIIAGAGSGKTRVLTRRVAYLMTLGIDPASILAITFTNKAAGEMKDRVGRLMGRQLRDFGRLENPFPLLCTFHSLCLRVLKHYAARVGLAPTFTVYDSADQTKVIKDAIKAVDLSATNFPAGMVHSAISKAKNKMLFPADYARANTDYVGRNVSKVYTKYQQMLDQAGAMDFDDLLMKTADMFRRHPEVLAELQERFKYILIDEYQDTNHVQYVIAHALAMKYRNVCVVGDPDQSIYAWRGADIQNILDFEQDYADARVVRLERNYRSTKRILAVADALIANNTQRKDKKLITDNDDGAKISVVNCQDEHDEAAVVTAELKKHNEAGIPWNGMAIFYRMNALSRVMEDALRRANVPYTMARGVEFYNRKEIKDTLAYLRVIANERDDVSLERILNTPTRGIGDSTVKLLQTQAVAHGLPLYEALRDAGRVAGVSSRAVKAIEQFVKMIDGFRARAARKESLTEVIADIFAAAKSADSHKPAKGRLQSLMEEVVKQSGLEALYLKERAANPTAENDPLANINELISSASEFDQTQPDGSLDDYLSQVSLVSDADHLKGGSGAVTLMTLHAAKGLEFPVVAMIGLEEGVLPHSRTRTNPDEIEEERRLCFVGITRAQKHLLMTKAQYRTIRGLRERTVTSPFVGELGSEHVELIDRAALSWQGGEDDTEPANRPWGGRRPNYDARHDAASTRALSAVAAKRSGVSPGQKVRHPTFGVGTVAELSQVSGNTRVIVDFAAAGRKTLILEMARLEML